MAVAAGMLLGSCVKEAQMSGGAEDNALVSFELNLEGAAQTRALSDGSGVNKLVYSVYDDKGRLLDVTDNPETDAVENQGVYEGALLNQKVQVNCKLLKGHTYQIVFWAQKSDCPVYDTEDLTKVSVKYTDENGVNLVSNNSDDYDAFAAYAKFTVNGNQTVGVTLKRPFAQINLATTAEDWMASVNAGVEITTSEVAISGVANEINLLTGEIGGDETVTFAAGEISGLNSDDAYKGLSMTYVLAGNIAPEKPSAAVIDNISYYFYTEGSAEPAFTLTEGLANVPVQANWRTNIFGSFFTGDVNFDITLNPDYDVKVVAGPKKVSIMGDSYSTFSGYIPSGYATYYPRTGTGVVTVQQTWWHQLCDGEDFVLEVNDSWSGSTISRMGYSGPDQGGPFISEARLGNLGNPDVILIFGGTNDAWNSRTNAGEFKYSDWTEDDLLTYRPALAYLLSELQRRYPSADVYFMLNTGLEEGGRYVRNSCVHDDSQQICDHYKVPVIRLQDIAKIDDGGDHPSVEGMTAICSQVYKALTGEEYVPPTPPVDPVTWYYTPANSSTLGSTSVTSVAGFAYNTNQDKYVEKPINALGIAAAKSGTLAVGYTDGAHYELITTVDLVADGARTLKTYYIPTVTLPEGANLVFASTTDTGLFYYMSSGSEGPFNVGVNAANPTGRPNSAAKDNLSINIGYDAEVDNGTWNPAAVHYKVTYNYVDEAGNIIKASDTASVEDGSEFTAPAAPEITYHEFLSVYPQTTTVTGNFTVTYTYKNLTGIVWYINTSGNGTRSQTVNQNANIRGFAYQDNTSSYPSTKNAGDLNNACFNAGGTGKVINVMRLEVSEDGTISYGINDGKTSTIVGTVKTSEFEEGSNGLKIIDLPTSVTLKPGERFWFYGAEDTCKFKYAQTANIGGQFKYGLVQNPAGTNVNECLSIDLGYRQPVQ